MRLNHPLYRTLKALGMSPVYASLHPPECLCRRVII
ncbi:hypothetical protein NP493_1022g00011 [Ridgeia piscesae]|uniref:Uncharacterized protein n=1 Tax=Ridgeia piscesae TaxID=27915 RepID=A0AAD9KIG9_RIDPI|nr:hypothetical protein NP493_1022g00011 [Ridgeia piscesae]